MEKEVKGTRKMKEVLKTAVICFVMMLCILGLTDNTKAETIKDGNGVEIWVTTDKAEYKSGEVIRAEVVITNKGESAIENVSYTQKKLSGWDIKHEKMSGYANSDTVLQVGEGMGYLVTFKPVSVSDMSAEGENEEGEVDIEDEKIPLEDGEGFGETGNLDDNSTLSDNTQMDEVPQTDSKENIGIKLILACSGIVVAIFIGKKLKLKYDRRYIAYILIFGILGTMLQPIGMINARADDKEKQSTLSSVDIEQNDTELAQCSYYVIVDGKKIELKGQLSYSIKEESLDNEDTKGEDDDKDAMYTVSFNPGFEGGEAIEPQKVKAGEYIIEPAKPDREGYVFIGWYEDGKEYPDMFLSEVYPVEKDIILTAQWLEIDNDKDSDGDGVIDSIETLLLMDKDKVDTDGDGLDDGVEFELGTSPVKADSDDNGVNDSDEDYDKDGVTNLAENQKGTNPVIEDSDKDGLTDGEEVNTYKTNPLAADTDGDGADDKTETVLNTDPLKADEYFDVVMESDEEDTVKASVAIRLKGEQLATLNVERVYNDAIFPKEIPGYLGGAYDFSVDGTFESATLIFEFDESLVGSKNFDPVIYYYNEEEQKFEPLETVVKGNVASAKTTHFSSYILINRVVWEGAFQWMDVWEMGEYEGIEIVFVIDDSGSMDWYDETNERLEVVSNLIDKLPENSKIGIVAFDSYTTRLTQNLTTVKESAKSYLNTKYFYSSGGTRMYRAINDAFNLFESNKEKVLKTIVVLSDGESGDTYLHKDVLAYAKLSNVQIYTVGLGDSTRYFDSYMKPLAENAGGRFYLASEADKLAEIYNDIQTKIDIETDNDQDGIPNYYEDNMVAFNGVRLELDKNNPDTDGDGVKDGAEIYLFRMLYNEDRTKVIVNVALNTDPSKKDSDGDGLYDYQERTAYIDGKEVVVAPKDTQPLTPNGPKGMWDKHVEMYETTDIPTEYGEYKEEWEDIEDYLYDSIKGMIVTDMTNIYRLVTLNPFANSDFMYNLIYKPIVENEAEEISDEIMGCVKDFRNGLITEEQAREILSDVLEYRAHINMTSGTLMDIADGIKEIVDLSGDKGVEVGAYMLTFVPDTEEQAYHSMPETWQRSFGYNVFFDEVFDIGTDMEKQSIEFVAINDDGTKGELYALWMWKGDYWNLKSGAEVGLYTKPSALTSTLHYSAIDFELPMVLGLYNYYSEDDIECIFNWAPKEKQWWITGFNPEYDEPNSEDMVMIGKVDFAGYEEMYRGIYKEISSNKKYISIKDKIMFDEDGHTIWIIY